MTRVYALRYNKKKEEKYYCEDYIAIKSEDGIVFITVPVEKIKAALKEFEQGEEVNVNLF